MCNIQYTNKIEKSCNNIEYTIYKINRRAATRWNNKMEWNGANPRKCAVVHEQNVNSGGSPEVE